MKADIDWKGKIVLNDISPHLNYKTTHHSWQNIV
jgi:hypothetical protein